MTLAQLLELGVDVSAWFLKALTGSTPAKAERIKLKQSGQGTTYLNTDLQGYYTINQFLELYPMGRSSFYRLVSRGELVIIKIGRSSRLAKAQVAAWEAELKRKPANDNQ